MRVINIKEDNPNVDYAIYLFEKELEYSHAVGNKSIIVIHGYGSHGVGGLIKQALKERLAVLKKHKKIEDYVSGEEWGEFNPIKQKMCAQCPELILNSNLQGLNSGVTVVLIK